MSADRVSGEPLALLFKGMGVLLCLRALKLMLVHIDYYGDTTLLFDFWGFSWVPKLPPAGGYLVLGVAALSGALMAAARNARVRQGALWLGIASFGLFFLQDKAFYGNLNYALLCILVSLGLVKAWRSLDELRVVSATTLLVPRVMVALMYFYAGVIKLSPDWLSGDVIGLFINADTPMFAHGLMSHPLVLMSMAVLGALFDLAIGPLLLWKKSRRFGLILMTGFHMTNALTLDVPEVAISMFLLTILAFASPEMARKALRVASTPHEDSRHDGLSRPGQGVIIAFLIFQCVWPLRPYVLGASDSRWTHVSQDFSWWLRSTSMTVSIKFYIHVDAQEPYKLDVSRYLDIKEQKAFAMDPYLVTQFVQHMHERLKEEHPEAQEIAIKVVSSASLNRCAEQPWIREDLDLVHEPLQYDMSHVVHPLRSHTCRAWSGQQER